ncbi:MAG: DUF411 domain-containing protein [Piscinibacter sp.]|uniref:DUF411 domain-containing protein n=1 Tax=Piscinibacter TaxID=1114981 RepID=UPI000FDD7599|nr:MULTISPECIES: DUF411 domain-containing protein [Piscinibacter]MCW5663748.1 DUF411 domain-containing protein [Piscinibacter sp.]
MRTSIDVTRRGKTRRALLAASGAVALLGPSLLRAQTQPLHMEVWKSPSCGCCKEWIKHVESRGFRVSVHDVGNTAARAHMKLPMKLGSCHTAVVGRYAVEGHVPAADVLRLIKEAPDAVGLAVPGMPVGSPGMDGPDYGDQRDPFDVLLVAKDGSTRVFSSYR